MRIPVLLVILSAITALAHGTPLPDGSFENGPGLGSGWSEVSSHDECPTGIGDWTEFIGTPAPDGVNSLWTGGVCDHPTLGGPISNSATQVVSVPADSPYLAFWYLGLRDSIEADDAPGDDVAYILADGAPIWGLDASTAAVNTWNSTQDARCYRNVMVPLTAYAGSSVSLTVGFDSGFSGIGNVLFDDFVLAPRFFADGFECGDLSGWSDAVP